MSCPICGREYGGNPACECFEELENLRATVRAMTETAAEQSRVHAEMHGDLVVQDELILKLGGRIKELEAILRALDLPIPPQR